jgi:hypothetical protein
VAHSYRLWKSLVNRCGWIRQCFTLENGLLVPSLTMPPAFARLRDQQQFFAARFPDALRLIQVGCFYECDEAQAEWMSRVLGLRLVVRRRGCRVRCGVPVRLGSWCAQALVARGIPVAIVREMEERPWLTSVKPRELTARWSPVGSIGD